ncbi:murein biosynthesis integral membrane protein MurJ [Tepidibacter thalassicus]|uniref:murein biosynthesis integral membrane protein MurJ n=1 Tax=Tepidibacter thalassicus TaxID=214905 RepID=UPI00093385B0|nr:murein biosynthesis integral membrane protein MurJ [Tepidibacter thalassicus]
MKRNTAIRVVSFMVFITFFSKVLGMLRDVFIASKYGMGTEAIAFSTASRIPLFFFDLGLGVAISSTFIPIFNEYLKNNEENKGMEFSSVFLNCVFILSAFIVVIGVLFSKNIVHMVAGGLDESTLLLSAKLLRILFPMIVFTGLAFTFVGILQSFGEFNIPSLISLASNLIVIGYLIFLNDRFGIEGLAVAMLIGWISQVVIQIPSLVKHGYKYKFMLNLKNEGMKKAGVLMLPILISAWVQPINTMVNIRLASYLNKGQAVVALDYANKLYITVVGIFIYSVVNLIFPSLSRINISKDKMEFIKIINLAIRSIIYILSPVMVIFIILRVPLISLVYERGQFDSHSTYLTSEAFMYYSIGMIAWGIQEIINKAFYALHDAITPMKISIVGIVFNICVSFLLAFKIGMKGLALATAISTINISIVLIMVINKKINGIFDTNFLYYFLKMGAASLFTGIVIMFVNNIMTNIVNLNTLLYKAIKVGVPSLIGIIFYVIFTMFIGIEESKIFIDIVKSKLKRG